MPYILQVLVGRLEKLTVFGSDYPTRDGACVGGDMRAAPTAPPAAVAVGVAIACCNVCSPRAHSPPPARRAHRAGTPLRDYIHVDDVARGHLNALEWMHKEAAAGRRALDVFNFGTGRGTSVLELIDAMEKASGKKVPYTVGPRRDGDLVASYCDPTKAKAVLGWEAVHDIDRMCVDAWRWQSANPEGFESKK
jgi:UDP-glucose 4-epimerase